MKKPSPLYAALGSAIIIIVAPVQFIRTDLLQYCNIAEIERKTAIILLQYWLRGGVGVSWLECALD